MRVKDEELTGWFTGRIPQGWFTGPPEIDVDREEVLIVGTLSDVELGKDAAPETLRVVPLPTPRPPPSHSPAAR